MTFSENLLKLRKQRGLAQTAVAESVGLTVRAYQRYEYGERTPSMEVLIALADLYDISLDELVCRKRKSKNVHL